MHPHGSPLRWPDSCVGRSCLEVVNAFGVVLCKSLVVLWHSSPSFSDFRFFRLRDHFQAHSYAAAHQAAACDADTAFTAELSIYTTGANHVVTAEQQPASPASVRSAHF